MTDLLDELTNPDLIEEAENQAARSNFRPPFVKVTCDIGPGEIEPYEATLNNGTKVNRVQLILKNLTGVKTAEGRDPLLGDTFALELGLPKRASANAEIALMVKSAMGINPAINSIKAFPGLKKVTLEEKVFKYPGRRPDGITGPDGRPTWKDAEGKEAVREITLMTYYYAVTSIGGAAVAATPKAEPTEAALARAAELLLDSTTEAEFNGRAIRDEVIQKGNLAGAIADGSWIKGQKLVKVEEGKLVQV